MPRPENDEFDPLEYRTIADTVIAALFAKPLQPLAPAESFPGAGVYLIYYNGPFAAYKPISKSETPIYVGKTIPGGSRRSPAALQQIERTGSAKLHGRLREHESSIESSTNLATSDFCCRYLVVTPIWIAVAEALLIERFKPVWNAVVDGFGLHHVGKTRFDQKRSKWDTLHPGRHWAANMKPGKPVKAILTEIQRHFAE